jgi:hypothetical protein
MKRIYTPVKKKTILIVDDDRVELAVKALTWLFKESPEPVSTATAQESALAETGSHESPFRGHATLGDAYEEARNLVPACLSLAAHSSGTPPNA